MDHRYHKVMWGAGNPRVRTGEKNWNLPKRWNARPFFACPDCGYRGEKTDMVGFESRCPTCLSKNIAQARRRVFCSSLADVFDNAVDPQWRVELFELIAKTPNLDWLLLTKRIGNARAMLNEVVDQMSHGLNTWDERPWPGVWLGATVVNQDEADRDIPKLLAVPARVRFLSIEPMLGPVDLRLRRPVRDDDRQDMDGWVSHITTAAGAGIHWVICGGESGSHARPMHPDWVRGLRDQCEAAGVPLHFKQWGEWAPYDEARTATIHKIASSPDLKLPMQWVGKKAAGRLLDGVEHNGFPTT